MANYNAGTGIKKGSKIAVEVIVAGLIIKLLAGQGLEISLEFEAALIVVLTGAIEMTRNYLKVKNILPDWLAKFI